DRGAVAAISLGQLEDGAVTVGRSVITEAAVKRRAVEIAPGVHDERGIGGKAVGAIERGQGSNRTAVAAALLGQLEDSAVARGAVAGKRGAAGRRRAKEIATTVHDQPGFGIHPVQASKGVQPVNRVAVVSV